MSTTIYQPKLYQQRQLKKHLKEAGVAIVLCDTIYGIVGIGATAVKIRFLKGRDERPFIRLISSFTELENLLVQTLPQELLAYWPGPLTCIAHTRMGDLALRIPSSVWLRKLIQELGEPLLSTSVNRSGEASLHSFKSIRQQFSKENVMLINAGNQSTSLVSTLIDVREKPFKLIRKGASLIFKEQRQLFF